MPERRKTASRRAEDEPDQEDRAEDEPDQEDRADDRDDDEPDQEDRAEDESGAGDPRNSRISAADAASAGLAGLAKLTGKKPEGVTSVEPTDDGWRVGVEVLEDERVPSSADILAIYEANLDPDGSLLSYRRTRRYPRSRSDSDGER